MEKKIHQDNEYLHNKISWNNARSIWNRYAAKYWWGDPLDVRFFLCKELNSVKNKRILDVGCNVGIILNSADNTNSKNGFDLNKDTIRIAKMINAKENLDAKFYVEDVFLSKFKKNSFDILILANVMPSFDYGKDKYTFEDCRSLINKCSAYLKKGGVLYLTSPNGDNPRYRNNPKPRESQLISLLKKQYVFKMKYWNPFPIYIGHLMRFLPGWFSLIEHLMKIDYGQDRCLSFYVKGVKK